MSKIDTWLDTLVSGLAAADRHLADEIRAIVEKRPIASRITHARGIVRGARTTVHRSLRNIVLRVGRPVLAIVADKPILEFKDAESAVWRARLAASSKTLQQAARAVGRIEVTGLGDLQYVGTGWLVEPNIILTNRHVALEFARRSGDGLVFRPKMTARIDFLEEKGRKSAREFPITEILHIEDETGPDFALLRVTPRSPALRLASPIPLAKARAKKKQYVGVIGYPARDARATDAKLMESIFGDVYDKKRLAPGQVTGARADLVLHDCSTLGGNSGSVLLDLETGHAVGLHFAGRFLEANYAVPAAVIASRLDRILRPKPGKPSHRPPHDVVVPPAAPVVLPADPGTTPAGPEVILESVPADYVGRVGYDSTFVGESVPLPTIKKKSDVLTFTFQNRQETELKYQHFSVVMSKSRRLCIFSAGNIDGSRPQRFKRPSWRMDGRIPAAQQIRDECYGNEPLFARGHMTRREDPVWGEPADASLGNNDSMHVTNTVPQMQPFNAGIWLQLESYALDHARADHMRISVFTGPFFAADDPICRGVLIPRAFWKIIAFVHDETRQLCATGYTMSQEDFLRPDEFVFGQHKTTQARIATIEQRAGLSFGALAALDPFDDDEEGVRVPLTDPSQIKFL